MTLRMGENEIEIDFVLIWKERGQSIHNLKAITGEFQHALVIDDIDKRKDQKEI